MRGDCGAFFPMFRCADVEAALEADPAWMPFQWLRAYGASSCGGLPTSPGWSGLPGDYRRLLEADELVAGGMENIAAGTSGSDSIRRCWRLSRTDAAYVFEAHRLVFAVRWMWMWWIDDRSGHCADICRNPEGAGRWNCRFFRRRWMCNVRVEFRVRMRSGVRLRGYRRSG